MLSSSAVSSCGFLDKPAWGRASTEELGGRLGVLLPHAPPTQSSTPLQTPTRQLTERPHLRNTDACLGFGYSRRTQQGGCSMEATGIHSFSIGELGRSLFQAQILMPEKEWLKEKWEWAVEHPKETLKGQSEGCLAHASSPLYFCKDGS